MVKMCLGESNQIYFMFLIIMPPLETPPEGERKPKAFTDEEVLEELTDALYGAADKVNFRFKHGTDKVEVYIGNSLCYIINRHLYNKLMGED